MLSSIILRRRTMWQIELNIAGHRFVHTPPDHGVDGRKFVGSAANRLAGLPAQVRRQVRHHRAA
jgi:hypothetical protein